MDQTISDVISLQSELLISHQKKVPKSNQDSHFKHPEPDE